MTIQYDERQAYNNFIGTFCAAAAGENVPDGSRLLQGDRIVFEKEV